MNARQDADGAAETEEAHVALSVEDVGGVKSGVPPPSAAGICCGRPSDLVEVLGLLAESVSPDIQIDTFVHHLSGGLSTPRGSYARARAAIVTNTGVSVARGQRKPFKSDSFGRNCLDGRHTRLDGVRRRSNRVNPGSIACTKTSARSMVG